MTGNENISTAAILIVDDAPENIDILNEILKEYRRKVATSGQEAIEISLGSNPPDLILLDVMMPEIDGFEVCRRLKADAKTSGIPIIFMTSLTDEDSKEAGFGAGAVDYITKPVQRKEVLARVKTHLSLSILEKQLQEQNKILEKRVEERTAELKTAKENAEEASRLKSHFLQLMSHEFRTPLTGILGLSKLLFDELNEGVLKEYSEKIYHSAVRLKNTLISIYNLSKLETGKQEVNYRELNAGEMLKNIASAYSIQAERNGVAMNIQIPLTPIKTITDESMFEVIINSLLDNAIKFTKKGKVTVSLNNEYKDAREYTVLTFEDTGIGIPAENLNYIFDAFRQGDEGLSRTYEGNGLGLAITRKYVDLLNGFIEVQSNVGTGSKFTIKLPNKISSAAKNMTTEIPPAKAKEVPGTLRNVLYVEDDEINVYVMKMMLKGKCSLDTAANAATGIELASTKKYEMILMDINLGGGMNGIEATKEIRKLPGYSATPIIAVTAYTNDSDVKMFLHEGCSQFLAKPFSKQQIIELLKQI